VTQLKANRAAKKKSLRLKKEEEKQQKLQSEKSLKLEAEKQEKLLVEKRLEEEKQKKLLEQKRLEEEKQERERKEKRTVLEGKVKKLNDIRQMKIEYENEVVRIQKRLKILRKKIRDIEEIEKKNQNVTLSDIKSDAGVKSSATKAGNKSTSTLLTQEQREKLSKKQEILDEIVEYEEKEFELSENQTLCGDFPAELLEAEKELLQLTQVNNTRNGNRSIFSLHF
jgi:hypothetical protein